MFPSCMKYIWTLSWPYRLRSVGNGVCVNPSLQRVMSAVEAGLDVSSLPENFTSHWDMSSAAFFCGTIITTIGGWGLTSKLPFEDPATANFSEVIAFILCCKDWILDKWKNKLFTEQFARKFKSKYSWSFLRNQTEMCTNIKLSRM